MEEYKSIQNIAILNMACSKMLKDKFNISLSNENIDKLLNEISSEIENEYCSLSTITLHELNNMTLSKIKKIYQNYIAHASPTSKNSEQNSDTTPETPIATTHTVASTISATTSSSIQTIKDNENEVLDDDYINYKLKELETKRRIIPKINFIQDEHSQQSNIKEVNIKDANIKDSREKNNKNSDNIYKHNPISITIPQSSINNNHLYKNFIINSLNRDWLKNPNRNNIRCNVSIDINKNILYPQCICFPKFVKNLTPYILMNINDGTKNVFYTFVCVSSFQDSRWDIWNPVDNIENIVLNNKLWILKFYDFCNNELNLGNDAINVLEVSKIDEKLYEIRIDADDNNYMDGDNILIKMNNNNINTFKIKKYNTSLITIFHETKIINIDDFINSKILNIYNQYSLIIKYHYNDK